MVTPPVPIYVDASRALQRAKEAVERSFAAPNAPRTAIWRNEMERQLERINAVVGQTPEKEAHLVPLERVVYLPFAKELALRGIRTVGDMLYSNRKSIKRHLGDDLSFADSLLALCPAHPREK